MGPYLDTSALAKWYLNEAFSEEFEKYIQTQTVAAVSRLTVVEMRCLLARRRRAREISRVLESTIFDAFEKDIASGFLEMFPIADDYLVTAQQLIVRLARFPLRTLDALHLAIAVDVECHALATADRTMAMAGRALGLDVVRFF